MTTKPTRSAFLQWMKEAGHEVKVLDVVSLGIYWREFANSLRYE